MNLFDQLEGLSERMQKTLIANNLRTLKNDIENEVAGGALDNLLYLLLKAMSLLFVVNKDYRKNIKDFTASYAICSRDKKIDVSAVFKKVNVLFAQQDGMKAMDSLVENPTTTVTFKDGKAMADFLLSGNTDVIAGMLNNQLSVSGNLNYLFKFIYLLWLIPELLGINDFKELLKDHA
ncbi:MULTISPECIES: hypothetical protein [Desulfobacula]|uniref:SCP2 domain-containing protein n=2 Tax=Desulfobacula TaxID=28222 RepID=K0NIY6_DESTT|nr:MULTISPECIES: hypothetical protein [Desulfobacula]CCK81411.1 uncharacterized protein TOL2_C32540 [Desulfobacula toluolica Tol2]SDU28446.1 hypothetical protein SAMN04487931_106116 [Desulfobacula phenolica]